MRGVLTPVVQLWSFGSPGGLLSPHFESVSVILTLFQKWGCNNLPIYLGLITYLLNLGYILDTESSLTMVVVPWI
jgi:hypothetical protein